MECYINIQRALYKPNPMLYGHFIEYFHRQIYGGIYDLNSQYAGEDGFRKDVIKALGDIRRKSGRVDKNSYC